MDVSDGVHDVVLGRDQSSAEAVAEEVADSVVAKIDVAGIPRLPQLVGT
jgi:hypothetical protein